MKQQYPTLEKPANIALFTGGIGCLTVLGHYVYYYAWTGQRYFVDMRGVIFCYVVPAVAAIALLSSLFMKQLTKIKVFVIVLSVGFSLFLMNLLIPVYAHAVTAGRRSLNSSSKEDLIEAKSIAAKSGIAFDTRSRLEVVLDFEKRGVKAVPVVVPNALLQKPGNVSRHSVIRINDVEVLPVAGISNVFTVNCNENGAYATYLSDEHGFNNPKGLWNRESMEVVAIGDSFTHGACVPTDQSFAGLVRKRFPETLNLGVPGLGPLFELLTLMEYAKPFKPKVVLWFFFEGNDIINLLYERESPLLMRYLNEDFSQNLSIRQEELDRAMESYVESEKNRQLELERSLKNQPLAPRFLKVSYDYFRDFAGLRHLRQSLLGSGGRFANDFSELNNERDARRLFGEIMKKSRDIVDEGGGKLYFVYLPQREQYGYPDNTVKVRDWIMPLIDSLGIPVIDMHTVFLEHGDPLSFYALRRMDHFNLAGHQKVAETVVHRILQDSR